jgi:hypothetical protein
MLNDLSSEEAVAFGKRFGRFRWDTGRDIAAGAETEIYNAWVILQCLKNQLREPGELTSDAFTSRYWIDSDEQEDDDDA